MSKTLMRAAIALTLGALAFSPTASHAATTSTGSSATVAQTGVKKSTGFLDGKVNNTASAKSKTALNASTALKKKPTGFLDGFLC